MTNNTHTLTKNLTTWHCTCERSGVLYTAAQRDSMTVCPHAKH